LTFSILLAKQLLQGYISTHLIGAEPVTPEAIIALVFGAITIALMAASLGVQISKKEK
jgi:hypothetical protein